MVVGASVSPAWVIPDEEPAPKALCLLLGCHGNRVRLTAPSLWEYELGNALKLGVSRGRFSAEEGREALRSLLDLGIALVNSDEIADRAWPLAIEPGLSIYDAGSSAPEEDRSCEFHTADNGLAKAATRPGTVRWVGEFE